MIIFDFFEMSHFFYRIRSKTVCGVGWIVVVFLHYKIFYSHFLKLAKILIYKKIKNIIF
jgi:hypothetical protein